MAVTQDVIKTKIPARLDRLPWSSWHWLIVMGLGTVWSLDGLEVTIKGVVGPQLKDSLGFTSVGVAGLASIYLFGAVSGALFWGYLTDRFGRQKLFIATLGTYMVGVVGTTLAGLGFNEGWAYVWFGVFRFITGFGIGGEYAAINSAIDELIPARVRGWVDLAINGSYWLGAIAASLLGTLYLSVFPSNIGWRIAFATGLILALGILFLRFFVPESPRWLLTHGYPDEADEVAGDIERQVLEHSDDVDELREPGEDEAMELRERRSVGFIELGRTLFKLYPRRSVVGFSLMITQAFLYNAIFFTYGLMLTTFFGVANSDVGWFLIPFAVGNFLGPLVLGRYYDTVGRRVMIPATFVLAGGLTILLGWLFGAGILVTGAVSMTIAWVIIFFFASAGASAGYLTISETFPLEVRAMAIALFYALATGIGGIFGPILFGGLIGDGGNRWNIFYGYLIGGGLMIIGGLVHRLWGVEAAQQSLESVAMPLSVQEAEGEEEGVSFAGPAGIDPTAPDAVRAFQRQHELDEDGVIGDQTRGALRAAMSQDGDQPSEVSVVDVTDPDSVRAFQARFDLDEDGIVGPETMGAIRAAERRVVVDPLDEEAVRAFQREHRLRDDGVVGPQTQAALTALRVERSDGETTAPFLEVDVLDPGSIRCFQRVCGLDDDGCAGPMTRGALRVETSRWERLMIDPGRAEEVRAFQREHGLVEDGVIGPQTREAMRREREETIERRRARGRDERRARLFGVDPLDPQSIRRFQNMHDLDADGVIGPQTRAVLRRRRHLLMAVDPTSGESIADFQREHGLTVDGVIGPETQGAMLALRASREPVGIEEEDEDARSERDEDEPERALIRLDPADADSVRRFQRCHGLEDDGVIGERTQAALRAVLRERERELLDEELPRPEREPRFHRRPLVFAGGLSYSAYIPGEDREYEREVREVVRALRAAEPLSRREIRDRVGARSWGPGRFSYVLKSAEEEGRVRRTGRDRYVRT